MTTIPADLSDRPDDGQGRADQPVGRPLLARVRTRADALDPDEAARLPALRSNRTAVRPAAQPPDIWGEDRPALRSVWLYARHGAWTGTDTLMRRVGAAYAVLFSLPITALLYVVGWIVERPGRLLVSAALVALLKLALTTI
jgi:hypothetical protein